MIIALLSAAGLLLAYQLANTLLLVFAGVLLAVVLDVATVGLGRILPINRSARLAIVSLLGFVLLAGGLLWGGMRLLTEARNLFEIATQQLVNFSAELTELGFIPADDDAEDGRSPLRNLLPDAGQLFGHAQTTFSMLTGVVSNTVIILFLAIFFAAGPAAYRDGFLKLLPVHKRPRVGQVLVETGHALRWWLVGQLATMVLVAVSIALMLFLTGVPNAILLGLLAGALNFIPFLGPILAAVPIILAVIPEGMAMLTLVMSLFVVIQSIEGYLINPLIQKRAVYLPPAWSLTALVAAGVLFGGMGVALATPLLAVGRILVLRLYVEDVLENRVSARTSERVIRAGCPRRGLLRRRRTFGPPT